ncbi:hypothetical protein [Corynebacterium sp. H78]|uniref:hypothetical protein n=1 Tax=Corynebacterium sp. H78 TaxID=3133417 RepID=UPI0030B588E5
MSEPKKYETYVAPEDPFISVEEFKALSMKKRGEALYHLLQVDADDHIDMLLDACPKDEEIASLIEANNYAKRFKAPLNPQVDPLPPGVKDVTPDKPVAHIAFVPRPKKRTEA